MKYVARLFVPAFAFALFLALTPSGAFAQGSHPAYLHALSDLRTARSLLDRPDHGDLHQEEKEARHHIDKAIDEIKKAAIDDGKDLNDHLPVDAHMDWPGRLHRALELLDKAHQDIARDEDNRFAQGLQQRAFAHIDEAKHEVREAIRIVESRQ